MASTLPHLEIVDRVKHQFPIVDSVYEYATSQYSALKNYNDYSKLTFGRAESTLQLVVDTVRPVIGRFEQPIHYADNIAVKSFDTLHDKIDTISRQSEELKTHTVQRFDSTRARLNSMKNETIDKVQTVLTVSGSVLPLINNIFAAGDYMLDYILPPPEGVKSNGYIPVKIGSDEKPSDLTVIIRALFVQMKQFSERVQERVVVYSREKWFPGLLNHVGSFKGNVENMVNSSPVVEEAKKLINGNSKSHSQENNVVEKKAKKSEKKAKKHHQQSQENNHNSNSNNVPTSPSNNGPPMTNGDSTPNGHESPISTEEHHS